MPLPVLCARLHLIVAFIFLCTFSHGHGRAFSCYYEPCICPTEYVITGIKCSSCRIIEQNKTLLETNKTVMKHTIKTVTKSRVVLTWLKTQCLITPEGSRPHQHFYFSFLKFGWRALCSMHAMCTKWQLEMTIEWDEHT